MVHLGARRMVLPMVEGLVRKTKLPCVHDLSARIQNGYRAKLKHMCVPETKLNLAVCQILYQQGFISQVARGDHMGIEYSPTTPDNVALRRYWLTLKYHDGAPVLNKMKAISIPSRKVFVSVRDMEQIIAGRRVGIIAPIQPGEVIIINTEKGVFEIHEALSLNIGGQALCRAY